MEATFLEKAKCLKSMKQSVIPDHLIPAVKDVNATIEELILLNEDF